MRSISALIIFAIFSLFSTGISHAITCDDCKEIHKGKQSIQQELMQKDSELNAAFQQKNFQQVNDLRTKMLELRKKMIELRSQDEKCDQACRPDIVRASECKKLMEEIVRLESTAGETDNAKIDAMYKEFQICNHDLEKLKKTD